MDWREEDRNLMEELHDEIVMCVVYAPDFAYPEIYPGEVKPTLDSTLSVIRDITKGIEARIGHQEWIPRLISKVEEAFEILRVHGRCRAGVAPLQEAVEIFRAAN